MNSINVFILIAFVILGMGIVFKNYLHYELEQQRRHLEEMFYSQNIWMTTPKLSEGEWDISGRYDRVKKTTIFRARKISGGTGQHEHIEWEE